MKNKPDTSKADEPGDYAIAFLALKVYAGQGSDAVVSPPTLNSPIRTFQAAIEATEEAVDNSLCMAETTSGFRGTVEALPLEQVRALARE